MARSPAVAHVNIPNTSQFYDKAVAHENQHVANYMTADLLREASARFEQYAFQEVCQ